MKKYCITLAGLLAFLIAPASIHATILIDDNFESYAVGSTPTNPGDGNPHNWYFDNLAADEVVAGGAPGESQMLHVQQVSSLQSSFGRQFVAQDGAVSSDLTLNLSFKLRLDSVSGNDYVIRLIDSSLTTNNIPIQIRIGVSGNMNVLTRATAPGVGGAVNVNPLADMAPANRNLALDTWYEFTIVANLTAQTYRVDVTNINNPTITGSTGDRYFYQNIHTLNELRFQSTSATNSGVNWNLDDVQLTAIPEPGAAVSLLFGVALLQLGRHAWRRME